MHYSIAIISTLVTLLISSVACADDQVPALISAAATGDVVRVKALLAEGANVNAGDKGGETALHKAASEGHNKIVALLLENGAHVNSQDHEANTPLHWAANKEVAAALLAHKAVVNKKDKQGYTPLSLAASLNRKDVVEILLEHFADIATQDNDGDSPLHTAASVGNKEIVQMLLAHGADVNAKDKYGDTPLHKAANKEVAELLLTHGADVNARSERNFVPLHFAANKEVATVLLAHGANVNAKSQTGETPLASTVRLRFYEAAAVILAKDCSVWPAELLLTEKISVPAIVDGKQVGEVELPVGTKLKLNSVQGDQVKVVVNGSEQVIPTKATDLVPRVIQICQAKAEQEKKAEELQRQAEAEAKRQQVAEAAATKANEQCLNALWMVRSRIKAKAEARWPNDYEMQVFEIKLQTEAYTTVQGMTSASGVPQSVFDK